MDKKKKVAVIVGSILLAGALGAAAAPPVAMNIAFEQISDVGANSGSLDATMNKVIESNPAFVAVIPRLHLTETWTAVDTAGMFDQTFNDIPQPMRDVYRNLPGAKKVMSNLKANDAADARIIANKTHAKMQASLEARNICNVIKNSTPTHIVTPNNEKIELLEPDNLSAYLDSCGGDAASYKDALSAVVVKRDLDAERAKLDAEAAKFDAGLPAH